MDADCNKITHQHPIIKELQFADGYSFVLNVDPCSLSAVLILLLIVV